MYVHGVITDSQSNATLPGASVTVLNSAGTPTGEGTMTNNQGFFQITSPTLDTGGSLMLSYVGYDPISVDPNVFNTTGIVRLDPVPEGLPSVVITPTKKSNAWLLYVLVAGGGYALLTSGKKKRGQVGAVNVDWTKIALTGGIAIGGYFLIVKPILTKLGILHVPSASEKATADAQAAALQQAQQQAAASGKGTASYAADAYTGWANDIFNIGESDNPDQSRIVNDIANCNNDVDMQLLITAFGQRKATKNNGNGCNWFGFGCIQSDLAAFVKLVLDEPHLNNLNLYLSEQGINYQF